MTNKMTKRALIASVLSLLLCVSMLIGSTFAWFTDTDTVTMNNIVSGTLNIEIVDVNGNEKTDALKFLNVNGDSDILWEPGATFKTEHFAIKNFGNLNLKFKLELNNTEVSYHKLNDAIDFFLVDAATGAKVDIATMTDIALAPNTTTGNYYIEGTMKADAGNEFQGLTLEGVSITVYATQVIAESDANGNDYDEDATYDDEVITVGDANSFIAAFANLENDQIVTLTADIDMTGKAWTPVDNKSFTLNGNGHTIKGLNGGMSDHTGATSITIKNVSFEGLVDNSATNYAGLIGDADTCSYINLSNVTITGADISSAKYAAGFVAYTSGYGADYDGPVNASHNFTDCVLTDSTVVGAGSTGGLIGHAGGNKATTTTISGFTANGNTITGEDAEHTGNILGTSHVGEVVLTYDVANVQAGNAIGRFVPGTTGKLIVNGEEQTAFTSVKQTIVSKNDDIPTADIQNAFNTAEGGVVDFSGSTVVQKPGSAYALYYPKLPGENAIIKNLNTNGSLYGLEMHGDITFENCTFTGTYAMNISDGNAEAGKVTFKNCTFQGWLSFQADIVTSAEFIDCKFVAGSNTLFMNNYQDTTFINCEFDSSFGIDDELAGEQTWTFTGCTGLNEANLNATGSYKTVTIIQN